MAEPDMQRQTETPLRHFFLKFGKVLAVVLHPCFLFFYVFSFIFFVTGPFGYTWTNWFVVLALTVILPAAFPILYAKDAFLQDRKKRPLTLLFTIICYSACLIYLKPFSLWADSSNASFLGLNKAYITSYFNGLPFFMLACLILGLILQFVVSFWFKISLHASGVGFLAALSFMAYAGFGWHGQIIDVLFDFYNLLMLFFISILLWQRVASGAHRKIEVFVGFAAGFFLTLLVAVLLNQAANSIPNQAFLSGCLRFC